MNQRLAAIRDDHGASAVEYGLLVVAIAAILVLVIAAVGILTKDNYQRTCDTFASAQGQAAC